jgi:hypothetical protein
MSLRLPNGCPRLVVEEKDSICCENKNEKYHIWYKTMCDNQR